MTVTATMEDLTPLERQLGTVDEAMTRNAVLLAADMTAEMALRRLDQKAVSGAPVVDHGRVVGVITRRDLLVPTLLDEPSDAQAPGRLTRLAGLRVSDLMSSEPVTAPPDCSLVQAVRTMIRHGVNRIPVVDQAGRPIGVLTRDDVLGAARGVQRMTRIGVLTGGGDVPGLNPASRRWCTPPPTAAMRSGCAAAGPACSTTTWTPTSPRTTACSPSPGRWCAPSTAPAAPSCTPAGPTRARSSPPTCPGSWPARASSPPRGRSTSPATASR